MKTAPPQYADRFWSRVDKSGSCWLWTGSLVTGGYGSFSIGPMTRVAHRIAWELSGRELAAGRVLDHQCHNMDSRCPGGPCDHRRCVNPDHLRLVTPRVNVLSSPVAPAALNARKTECDHGHQLSNENLVVDPKDGHRSCRECRRMSDRRRGPDRRRERQAALSADPSLAPHGVLSTYNNWMCRCDPCRDAYRSWRAAYVMRREAVTS